MTNPICQHCGTPMQRPPRVPEHRWAKRKWCDKLCMDAARAPKPRDCQRCGQTFTPAFNRKRGTPYCSIRCANMGKPIKGPYRKMRKGEKVVAVHRVVAEEALGRPLAEREVVHHQDHNKANNSPSNFKIMNNSEHSRHHMRGNTNARRS